MPESRRVLLVDDDPGVVDWLTEELSERGFTVEGVTSPTKALARVSEQAFDVVVSDIEMPEMRGIDLVRAIHEKRPTQLVLLITAFGSIELAMNCVRAGAADFIAKPFPIQILAAAIDRTLRDRAMKRQVVRLRSSLTEPSGSALVARSPAMQRVLETVQRVAGSSSTVLLTGETGVGKTLVAGTIHAQSPRREKRFVQINCAAMPGGLVEAELFGVRKGAFTDARESRDGLFVHADGGTLLLDEVGEMALDVQPKLLICLETGSFRPLGARDEVHVDVRLIAATNQPLEHALRDKRLRADLYHRLNVIGIDIPPLRERVEEIPFLVDEWLRRLAPRAGRALKGVTDEAMRWLRAQPWPGNVRELANVLERAVMLSDHDVLVLEDFVSGRGEADAEKSFLETAVSDGLPLDEVERRYIELVLERAGGNKAKAARILGVDRTTLYRRRAGES